MALSGALVLGLTSCVEKHGFADADSSGDGSISAAEFDHFMLEAIHGEVDVNGDGNISFDESTAANSGVDKAAFKALDADGNGMISRQETKAQIIKQGGMTGLFKQVDSDGSGALSKAEWSAFRKSVAGRE